jgi:hypothetical protein
VYTCSLSCAWWWWFFKWDFLLIFFFFSKNLERCLIFITKIETALFFLNYVGVIGLLENVYGGKKIKYNIIWKLLGMRHTRGIKKFKLGFYYLIHNSDRLVSYFDLERINWEISYQILRVLKSRLTWWKISEKTTWVCMSMCLNLCWIK